MLALRAPARAFLVVVVVRAHICDARAGRRASVHAFYSRAYIFCRLMFNCGRAEAGCHRAGTCVGLRGWPRHCDALLHALLDGTTALYLGVG
eukprot:6204539-Pleurochrysis_carterae.AAC.1